MKTSEVGCWSALVSVAATGAGGVLLLIGFFSLFMAMSGLIVLLPLIAGFNGAVSGYNLVEKRSTFTNMWLVHTVLALVYVVVGFVCLRCFFPLIWAPELRQTLIVSGVISLGCTFFSLLLGRWIAQKSKKTDLSTHSSCSRLKH